MTLVTRFEDLKAWQEARQLTRLIYKLTSCGPHNKDYALRDQLQRASVSAMTNIAEGFDCESRPEFGKFLGYARRSTVEVQSLLVAALDIGYIDQACFDIHYEQAKKTKALIGALKYSLQRKSQVIT